MRAFVVLSVLVLAAPALAGCLAPAATPQKPTPDGPRVKMSQFDATMATPTLLCHASACNFDMTPTPKRQGNEVTIAVNPTNPKNVVGGAKDYFPEDAGECVWDGVYVTKDGGATFKDRSFDGSPWRQLTSPDPSKVNYATQFWCTTDPVAYFNAKGVLYYVLMAYQADRVTGSKTCADVCPQGAFNDWAFNRAVQIVAISHDGGDTFDTFTPVLEGSFPVDFHDKAWVAASADGIIHVGWLSGAAGGNLYFRSTDGGKTYADPQIMANSVGGDSGQGTFIDVGPGKEVYYAWEGAKGIDLRRSMDDGVTWDALRTVIERHGSQIKNTYSDRDSRNGFPAMATDRSPDSPFSGAVYFTWSDGRDKPDPSNIYFAASFDKGEHFTAPIRLNDDATEQAQMMPAISVSPGGVIDVAWMDQRLDTAGNTMIDEYYTYSLDGGKSWAPNFRVRDAAGVGWDPHLSHHQNGKVFIGDYADIDSSWQAAHPVWPDTRDGKEVKVYTATIERPMFANGFPDGKRGDALAFVKEHPLS